MLGRLWSCCCCGGASSAVKDDEDTSFDRFLCNPNCVDPAIWNVPQFRAHLEGVKDQGQGHGTKVGKAAGPSVSTCQELLGPNGRCINQDVVIREGLCLNHDVCVHGSVTVQAPCCINGNISIAGDLQVLPGGSICLSGNALVVGNAHVSADTCVSGSAHVVGALTVEQANVDVTSSLKVHGETRFIARANPE